jgi:hypothetical protein
MISYARSLAEIRVVVSEMHNAGKTVRVNVCPEIYALLKNKRVYDTYSGASAELYSHGWVLYGPRHVYMQNGMIINGYYFEEVI